MKTLDKIKQIVEEQIDLLSSKSTKNTLSTEDIANLKNLAQTVLLVENKEPTKKRRPQGEHLSDDEILEYAKD